MPLTPGDAEPEADTWGVDFEMIAPNGVAVSCFVMRDALDQLRALAAFDKSAGRITTDEQRRRLRQRQRLRQLAVFARWREVIEATASQKYDSGVLERGMVVVRPEDLKPARGTMQ